MSKITILAAAYAAAMLTNTVVSKAEPISDQGFVRAVAERAFGLDQKAKVAAMAFPALNDALTIAALFDGAVTRRAIDDGPGCSLPDTGRMLKPAMTRRLWPTDHRSRSSTGAEPDGPPPMKPADNGGMPGRGD